ncbi:MAG: Cobalt-zinc-cadmium resistance protein CzcA Cation efflux system protein CusA [Frankiales bacterium]|nr:Cobalt-zinc-cadmium resistance protein CzcA Cation efflux system protein CusA [Frankiales bacterium]
MVGWLAGSSIRLRYLVLPIALALLGIGFVQLRSASTDVLPEYTPPRIEIQTEALGLAADEVEQLVTAPLESNLLSGVAWLESISSSSVTGLSSIQLVFERGTDLYRARQMVQERLTHAGILPHVSKPPTMIQPLSSTSRVLMVGLSSQQLSLIDLSVLTRFKIRPRLMGVPGVANVTVFGQRERQLQVHVDPERLAQRGVTLDQVIRTTGNALWVSPLTFLEASSPGTGGFIDTPNQRVGIQHLLPIATPQDLARVSLEGTPGRSLRLGDVADVVEDHQPLIGDAVVNDAPSLMLVVEKFPGADPASVTRDVEAALDALRPGLGGVETDTTVFRPATFIERAVDNVALAWTVGLLLGLALLAGLLFAWRVAVACLVAVPLSLLAALMVLQWRGTSVSSLVLVGLAVALGVLIDDVVVLSDAVARRVRGRAEPEAVTRALVEARGPLLFTTLVLLLVPLPVLLLSGADGAFFRPLVLSYGLAVLASLLVALVVTPAVVFVLSRRAGTPTPSPVARLLDRCYRGALARLLQRPRWVLAGTALALVAGLAVVPQLGGQPVLPAMQDRDLLVHWEGAPGTSRTEMNRITARASAELRATPGVRNVGAHVGRAVAADRVASVNDGQMWVSLHSSADYAATRAAIQRVLDGYPGLAHQVETYPQARVREIHGGHAGDVVVRVYGQEPAVLRTEAQRVQRLVAGVDGVEAAGVRLPVQEPTLEVQVDLAAAQRAGLKPGDVRRSATTLLSGIEVGNLFEEQKVFEVVVVGTAAVRHSLSSVEDVLIETPVKGRVRLGDLATVKLSSSPTVIRREGISPYLDVTAEVAGRGHAAVVRDIEGRLRDATFPVEYHAEVIAPAADTSGTLPVSAWVVAVALAAFLLLQAAVGSWRLATALFLTLPLGLTGALLAAQVDGGVTALSSFAGLLTVLGLATRWVVLLVRDCQRRCTDGELHGRRLVLQAAAERLPAMLMTSIVLAATLAPFAVLGDGPGLETLRPVALMVLGGLVSTLLLVLFAVPLLYLRFGAPPPEPMVDALVQQRVALVPSAPGALR